jgi:dATP/dGTP diphosphohydrolase
MDDGGWALQLNDKWSYPCYMTDNKKDTNPKDAVGIKKVPFSTISAPVMAEVGVAMMEGARKYGRHNYRASGVRASVYYDATLRHLTAYWEGEDIDPLSGLSHITKAIASLTVLRDAMIFNKLDDDRPPKAPEGWQEELNKKAGELIEKFPNAVPAVTFKG